MRIRTQHLQAKTILYSRSSSTESEAVYCHTNGTGGMRKKCKYVCTPCTSVHSGVSIPSENDGLIDYSEHPKKIIYKIGMPIYLNVSFTERNTGRLVFIPSIDK